MRILPEVLLGLGVSSGLVLPATALAQARPKKPARPDWIVKTVDFREATLTDVLECLRQKTQEQDPERRGANIVLGPGGVGSRDKKLTLSLRQVPFTQVLRYVAELIGLEMRVDDGIYILDSPKRLPAAPRPDPITPR